MASFERILDDEAATQALGRQLAKAVDGGLVVYLHGDLGAGKTTWARAFLRALGVGERVKSPTYSLVEAYPLEGCTAYHLDLYRIADPAELEWLGLDALGEASSIVLVEWPERGRGGLPVADVDIELAHLDHGRSLRVTARNARGEAFVARIRH